MYRYVPFEEIDKNKWNGAVHYAHNGNVHGYYWYLKAVFREWDAVIEDDYQSVMPIISSPLHDVIYDLIPQLGPYSVNVLHSSRIKDMISVASEHSSNAIYPLNRGIHLRSLKGLKTIESPYATFMLNKEYEALSEQYDSDVFDAIHEESKDHLSFVSGMKPELLVDLSAFPAMKKNALMRIMYNAIQRGIGFSNGIKSKSNDDFLAASFFIASHNTLYEIFTMPRADMDARRLLLDLVIRNGAGKPMNIQLYDEIDGLEPMGFKKSNSLQLYSGKTLTRIKKAIKLPY
ncbi:MAG: hypothetical protein HKN68_16160 [Saprospiraceae bacterium]|nr:hypothetical protein [Saprospiraceae bacterium]